MSDDFTSVTAADVGRHYGRRKALANVSFTCAAGDIVGLLGPNGAGKSTLLAILATLLSPSTGTVRYGDLAASDAGPRVRGRLGVLGHDLYLYPELTARENLAFFARLYGLDEPDAVVARSLEHARLAARADDPVSSYSRGMRQRLALERALIHRPRLVLLDEPFTGLDQASTAGLVARLQGLRDEGTIVIAATHDLDVAAGLLTRVLYLRQGRLVHTEAESVDLRARYQAVMAGS